MDFHSNGFYYFFIIISDSLKVFPFPPISFYGCVHNALAFRWVKFGVLYQRIKRLFDVGIVYYRHVFRQSTPAPENRKILRKISANEKNWQPSVNKWMSPFGSHSQRLRVLFESVVSADDRYDVVLGSHRTSTRASFPHPSTLFITGDARENNARFVLTGILMVLFLVCGFKKTPVASTSFCKFSPFLYFL